MVAERPEVGVVRIFDCCLYNGESELFEARQHEWKHVPDVWHVAVMFDETFQGNTQPTPFPPRRAGGNAVVPVPWHDLIGDTPWEREGYARDCVGDTLRMSLQRGIMPFPEDDDLIFLCDGDEIVKSAALEGIVAATSFGPVQLPCTQHYYDLCHVVDGYVGKRTKALRWRDLKPYAFTLSRIWDRTDLNGVSDACWHYSMLGGPRRVLQKLMSFSHTELQDEPGWVTLENVRRLVAERRDLVPPPNDRNIVVDAMPGGELAPQWLWEQASTRWRHLLYPTIDVAI